MHPPENLYRSVLREVAATAQGRKGRRALPDWLLASVVAAVVVIAVGVGLLMRSAPGPGGVSSPPAAAVPSASPIATPSTTRYESDYMPWAIDLPATWTPGTAQGDDVGSFETFIRYRPTRVTAGVGSSPVPAGTTGNEYLEQAVANDSECAEGPVDRTDTTMGQEPAVLITYECDSLSLGLVVTIHNDRRYIITFDAAAAAEPDVLDAAIEELLPAFEFTD